MREMGVRGLLVYCSDYHCSHWTTMSADQWPDDVRLSDLEPLFVCQACGTRAAELRPDFEWGKSQRSNVRSARTAWREMQRHDPQNDGPSDGGKAEAVRLAGRVRY